MNKPVWAAPERNRQPISEVLQQHIRRRTDAGQKTAHALEVGSGTGQHIVHFAQHLPDIRWQSSDCAEYLDGIRLWVQEASLPNLPPPVCFDVRQPLPDFSCAAHPDGRFDLLYSANTLHIMHWQTVERFFRIMSELLRPNALVVLYGPFNYGGQFTSDSNAAFDASLKQRDAGMGIRDSEAVIQLAATAGLQLTEDIAMPANNRSLVFAFAASA